MNLRCDEKNEIINETDERIVGEGVLCKYTSAVTAIFGCNSLDTHANGEVACC